MSKIAVIAKFTTAPGKRDELAQALEKMLPQVETEDGTELYILSEDSGNADVLWMFELYTDGDALQVHSSSPSMMEFFGVLGGDLLAAPPELMMASPRVAKGVEL